MGTDKGLMLFQGKPMILHTIDNLNSEADRIFIVANQSGYENFGLEVMEDEIKGIGPAGGIHAALKNCTTEKLFITSCDMPFVPAEIVRHIIDNSGDAEITLPVHNGNVEPLCGVYSKKCLEKWNQLIRKDIIKLQEMVTHFKLNKLDVGDHPAFKDMIFSNINTRNDLENATN